MKIELTGYTHCGKTYLAKMISREFGYIDADFYYNKKNRVSKIIFLLYGLILMIIHNYLISFLKMKKLINQSNKKKPLNNFFKKSFFEHYVLAIFFRKESRVIFSESFFTLGKTAFIDEENDLFWKFISYLPIKLLSDCLILINRMDYADDICASEDYKKTMEKMYSLFRANSFIPFYVVNYVHTIDGEKLIFDWFKKYEK